MPGNKKAHIQAIQNIFTTNLGIKKNEKILIFTDDKDIRVQNITRIIAREATRYSQNVLFVRFASSGSHGIEPPDVLWSAAFGKYAINELKTQNLLSPILNKKTDKKIMDKAQGIIHKNRNEAVRAVIALSYYSTSHTKFRMFLTNICKSRYASMPLFDRSMLNSAMAVDWDAMKERTVNIARKVNQGEKISIETPNGTHLVLSKKGRKTLTDTGNITRPGAFSNLPAGEVFLAPLEGSAQGRLVLEWAPTRKLRNTITLSVKNGRVVRVSGQGQYACLLRKKLRERDDNRNIAELGIGTNDKASRPDNILESEKIMGTIHIALGDNSTFGGKISTPFHQDFIFFQPTLTVMKKNGSRKVLIQEGTVL